MKKRHLIFLVLLVAALTLIVSGCGNKGQSLEGKNIVTIELEGGILDYGLASTSTNIFYAYEPGSYILDPTSLTNYSLYRIGYNFTGWYTSPECDAASKWDFKTPFNTETLTLYAGWKEAIVYSFTVYYVDGETPVSLGTYEVEEGYTFDDWRNYANTRNGYTALAYYSDMSLSTPWDKTVKHPGGGENKDIPVYVSYMEGEWELVNNYEKLVSALKANKNVYLTDNIDCGGKAINVSSAYTSVFNGKGFTVSNFSVARFGTTINPKCAIFNSLGEGAQIKDVTFTDVAYDFTGVNLSAKSYQVAALAVSANGAKVSNVKIEGSFTTNCDTSLLTKANSFFYEEDAKVEISADSSVNVTFE